MTKSDGRPRARQHRIAWRVVEASAIATLVANLINIPVALTGTSPPYRPALAASLAGVALLWGLAIYGLLGRARWGAWTAGVMAVLTVLSPLVPADSSVWRENWMTLALAWGQAAACLVLLAGLSLHRLRGPS